MNDLIVVGNFYYSSTVEDQAKEVLQLLRDNGYVLAKGDGNQYMVEIAVEPEE